MSTIGSQSLEPYRSLISRTACEHFGFEVLVRRELGARRRRDDDHRESAAQLRRLLPEPIERAQSLRNSFRVVDAIDADAERAPAPRITLAQRARARVAVFGQRESLEGFDVDADREDAERDLAPVECDA